MIASFNSRSLRLLFGLLVILQPVRGDNDFLSSLLKNLFTTKLSSNNTDLNLLDTLLLDVIPPMLGQPACNAEGTASEHKNEALYGDQSSKFASFTTPQQLITDAGFKYKNFNVISADGYHSQLIRLINPLADRKKLKSPPVMMFHGGRTDPTNYIYTTTKKHHPEKYPRRPEDGPITSYNRSLAFTLCNHGYDVWLVGTRGSNKQNRGRRPDVLIKTAVTGDTQTTRLEAGFELAQYANYFSYSMNELRDFEIDAQIDKVLLITAAKKVSIVTYSLSTMTTMPYLTPRSDGKESKVHNYVQFAPIINQKGTSKLLEKLYEIGRNTDDSLGTLIVTKVLSSRTVRALLVAISENAKVRYLITKFITVIIAGSSPKYQTCLDLNVIGHLDQPTSFREMKHAFQQTFVGQFQRYDYGPITNQILYGQLSPPVYDISNLTVSNWMIVSGENDILATPESVRQVISSVKNIKPRHIHLQNYNHIDLGAAFDCGDDVNLPILHFFDQHQLS